MPLSLIDAVIASDTQKHFRESFNSLQTEVVGLRQSANLGYISVNETFKNFKPEIVTGLVAKGKFNGFEWSALDGGTNSGYITNPFSPVPPTGISGPDQYIEFGTVAGVPASPLTNGFLYKARNTFKFGTDAGNSEQLNATVRYAPKTYSIKANTKVIFGLYEGNNIASSLLTPGLSNRSILISANFAAALDFIGTIRGIGAGLTTVVGSEIPADAILEFGLRVTPTEVTFKMNGAYVTEPIPAAYAGIEFNLAFGFYSAVDTSTIQHFIDSVGYESTLV